MEVLPAQEYETPSAPPIPFYDHPSLNEQREWEAWRVAERQEYFSHPSMPPFQEVGRTSSFAYEQQTPSNMISQAPQGDLHNGWEGPEAHQGLHGWAAAHPASAAIWADAPPSVKQVGFSCCCCCCCLNTNSRLGLQVIILLDVATQRGAASCVAVSCLKQQPAASERKHPFTYPQPCNNAALNKTNHICTLCAVLPTLHAGS